jgi:hypothetical protein
MAIVASGQMTLVDMNDNKQLVSYIGSSQQRQVIFNPNNNTYSPNYSSANQVLTPQLFIAGNSTDIISSAKSVRWFYQTNSTGSLTEITASGSGYTLGTGAVKTLTISSNVLASNTSMTYIVEIVYTDTDTGFDVLTKAEIELVKITNGSDGADAINALAVVLSNEAHVIPSDSAGGSQNYSNSGTTIRLYEGASELTYDGTGTSNGTWKVTASGSGITAGSITDSGTYATVGNASAMGGDTGKITYTITGKRANGTTFSLTKDQTFTKSKQGIAGTSPTAYTMIASADALQKDISNNFTPASITFTAKSQTGNGTIANYNARWVIEDTTDLSTWTARTVAPTTDESSKTYTPSSANVKAVRVKMYVAGGTTTLLDEQTIPVVSDGATGAKGDNSIIGVVWTPEGNTLKNSEGTLKAQMNIYNGTAEVTSGITYKWYIQDPSATASSGGDSDGGTGWRLLNSTYNAGVTNYTTKEITIPASAIASVESFLCVATYGGKKYKDVCTVTDVTDPILVTVIGMNTFKNGEGTTELKAILYRNGAEIDSAGTEYTYTWSLYNQQNVKVTPTYTTTMTGKTITVDGRDVDGRANIICEVSK